MALVGGMSSVSSTLPSQLAAGPACDRSCRCQATGTPLMVAMRSSSLLRLRATQIRRLPGTSRALVSAAPSPREAPVMM